MDSYYNDGTAIWTTWTSNSDDSPTSTAWYSWNNTTETSTGTAVTSGYIDTWNNWNRPNVHYIYNDTHASEWNTWVDEAEEKRQNRLERRKARALTSRKERIRQQKLRQQQLREALKRKQEAKRQAKIEERRKQKAEETAWKLLEDIVTPEQAKRYKETGRLLVHGQKYDWLIKKPSYNGGKPGVVRVEKGKLTDICVHTNNGRDSEIPEADRIVSIALSAKFNEKAFDQKCNKWGNVQMPDEYLKECANF